MTTKRSVKVGVLLWPQHSDWASLMDAGARVDHLGYDNLWVWDHLLPITGEPAGPSFEAFMTLAGWAAVTTRVTLGPMVAANTFRNPALLVKMITGLDHLSHGRAILGVGSGWFEAEHRAFGIDFGASAGERLDWMDEAAALIHDMFREPTATARGPHYAAVNVANDPPPVQPRIPLVIGGAGERKTLATVARYADIWNVIGTPAELRHKDAVLRDWCARVGRDESAIERTTGGVNLVIRDSAAEAEEVARRIGSHNRGWDETVLTGPPSAVIEHFRPFIELGFRTIYIDVPAPYDRETLERFMREVKPALESIG